MTRKKRKEKKQSTSAIDSSSQNTSGNEVNNTENIEVSIESRKLRGKLSSSVATSKSSQTKGVREVLNSGSVDNSERVGTRRSMRRPSSSAVDASASSPPVKRMKKIVESGNDESSPIKITNERSERSNAKKQKESARGNFKAFEINDDKQDNTERNDGLIQENHINNRKSGKYEKTRKRRLVDVNEDSNISTTSETHSRKGGSQTKDKNVVSPNSESKSNDIQRSIENSKKRRKVNKNEMSDLDDSNSIDQSDERILDKETCRCPLSANERQESAEKRPSDDGNDSDAEWKTWCETFSDVIGDPLCNRKWKSSPTSKSKDDNSCFSILSYNILAESLLKKSHYFKNIAASHWNQHNRHELLMKELKEINPDILCLQEVEKEYQSILLSKDLSSMGYNTFYACSESTGKTEGVAIYYRNSRFTEIARRAVPLATIADSLIDELNISVEQRNIIRDYTQEPQMLQLIALKCQNTGQEVCLCNAHISYAKHRKPDLRCVQVARSIDYIMSFISSQGHLSSQSVPFIFCGDFNSKPSSSAYQLCRDGYLNDSMLNSLQQCQNVNIYGIDKDQALVNILWKAFQHSVDDLQSCYYEILNREPPLTINLEGHDGCVDYIWFTKRSLSVEAVLIPRSIVLRQLKDSLPNADFPSDHLSLCARLSFK